MSNERSPREVCSITIGISGLIRAPLNISRVDWSSQRLLATGGPQFRLGAEPRDELVGRVAGHLQVDLQRAAAAAEHLVEALEQGARPRLDDRAVDAHVRGIDELVQCGAAERLLDVRRDLGAEAALDLDA